MMVKATRDSWENLPMPEKKSRLPFFKEFTHHEFEILTWGNIPEDMEDKWFIFFEDGKIYFCRSWTGFCIYEIEIEQSATGYQTKNVWVNRDSRQYIDPLVEKVDENELFKDEIETLTWLIDAELSFGKNNLL